MQKIIIITGFTGSGKSGLAIDIAKKYNGEIISCDSVQIYKGLDIGSAKVTQQEMQGIKHHLIDILKPDQEYSVGQFVQDCQTAINDIVLRGKLPILVGGTGLYIKSLLQGYNFSGADKNLEFRQNLANLAEKHGKQYVWDMLNNVDPVRASGVHPNNLKRVIRYLEVCQFGNGQTTTKSVLDGYDTLCIGIVEDRDLIYDKIDKRVDIMLDQGLKQEVETLLKQGVNPDANCMNTIGYREMIEHLRGEIDYQRCVELIKQHTRNYCKRQLTFMKTMPELILANITEAKQKIEEFLNDKTN